MGWNGELKRGMIAREQSNRKERKKGRARSYAGSNPLYLAVEDENLVTDLVPSEMACCGKARDQKAG